MDNFVELLKKAADGDEAAVQTLITYFHEHKASADEQESAHHYLKQTPQHTAIYLRGLLYESGYGVPQDWDMSFLLMREAASKGNAKATYEVGLHFMKGMGVAQSFENARQWLKIAASSPYYIVDAMYYLGEIYEQGLGIDKDLATAREWYVKAAQKGHLGAQKKKNL